MGRKKAYSLGQVVQREDGTYGLIVDYRQYEDGSGAYRLVTCDKWGNVEPRLAWVRTSKLSPVMTKAGSVRRKGPSVIKRWRNAP